MRRLLQKLFARWPGHLVGRTPAVGVALPHAAVEPEPTTSTLSFARLHGMSPEECREGIARRRFEQASSVLRFGMTKDAPTVEPLVAATLSAPRPEVKPSAPPDTLHRGAVRPCVQCGGMEVRTDNDSPWHCITCSLSALSTTVHTYLGPGRQ